MVARLRAKCARIPGATCIFQANQDLRIGARMSSAQYQYTIQSDTLQDLVKWGPILLKEMKKTSRLDRRQHRPAEQRAGILFGL